MDKQEYGSLYKELEVIGRGNFGSATLVQDNRDGGMYIAKKIMMNFLNPKEKEFSLLEAKILRDLKHPNIVNYRDSFIEKDTLIIIMEYCEEGDLAFHIKRKVQKGEQFPEKVILNWFLQIVFALDYIHTHKIIHRDIKTSNIFLTSNGTVKIGDFGISKVLEGTFEAANTVVGTPYYMSPEVCENRPYTYKSDIWALGCVLYELCTLKHAFAADNLLGLVFKIVKDQHDPIPSIYSKDLSNIVQSLLSKNEKERLGTKELMREPFIVSVISDFLANRGANMVQEVSIPIKKTAVHVEIKKEKEKEINETPAERMKRKKEEEARRREDQMKEAARASFTSNAAAKQRKLEDLQGSSPQKADKKKGVGQSQITSQNQPQSPYLEDKSQMKDTLKSTVRSKFEEDATIVSFNGSITENSIYMKTQDRPLNVRASQTKGLNPDDMGSIYESQHQASQISLKPVPKVEERKMSGTTTQKYQNEEFDDYEEYYSDDFEEDDDARLTKKAGETEMKEVLQVYKTALEKVDEPLRASETMDKVPTATSSQITTMANKKLDVIDKKKQECIKKMGQPLFEKVYSLLKKHLNAGTSNAKVKDELAQIVEKKDMNSCLMIEEILFLEATSK